MHFEPIAVQPSLLRAGLGVKGIRMLETLCCAKPNPVQVIADRWRIHLYPDTFLTGIICLTDPVESGR
ncbi:MAG: hypothetical protein Q7T57_02175 [Dehalococcoidales bacterium]|nr:hypothetical protein [Dehalococcoidales bacterium]